jgi:hypothetical protein
MTEAQYMAKQGAIQYGKLAREAVDPLFKEHYEKLARMFREVWKGTGK